MRRRDDREAKTWVFRLLGPGTDRAAQDAGAL
jgi:hypothetical protein